ncbi:MAG: ABC transporter ATP-binding protein [Acidobacteria bacterium]|nr:ABC transporter ATP-binding protein [Acidobacteriota bacterium]
MLHVTNLRMTYPGRNGEPVEVLWIPSFSLAAGEQVALLGESGQGKTTLLHLLAGILTPTEGQVVLGGTDLTRLSEAARDRFRAEKIGYIFQNIHLLPAFTAQENLELGMLFAHRKHSAARAKELLTKVGLAERLNFYPGELSAGQQQRVGIARALANQPVLVLADEPTSALDANNRETALDLMQNLCREQNTALLVVTHDQQVAARFSRIWQLAELNQLELPGRGAVQN